MPLRVAAISFLNPAPLLYHFEHEPAAADLRTRYLVHYTSPARCAAELHGGQADLGLIPVAELTPRLAVVPGCTIASQYEVRSILLLIKHRPGCSRDDALRGLRTLAADSASRSSVAYVKTILRHFFQVTPLLEEQSADPLAMLQAHDGALLIGDPALLAREHQEEMNAAVKAERGEHLLWIDLAQLWHELTELPWVAAVWAIDPRSLPGSGVSPMNLIQDLTASRDAGLAHTEELVAEWLPRLPLQPETIRTYLTRNIYYVLDERCLAAIRLFRNLAAQYGVLPPLPELILLQA